MRLRALWATLLLGCAPACSCESFPTRAEVDAFFDKAPTLSPEVREQETHRLFTRLRAQSSQSEDAITFHAASRFIQLFTATQDERLLAGLDAVRLDGGFTVTICLVYEKLASQPGFVAYYRKGNPVGLRRLDLCGLELTAEGVRPVQ